SRRTRPRFITRWNDKGEPHSLGCNQLDDNFLLFPVLLLDELNPTIPDDDVLTMDTKNLIREETQDDQRIRTNLAETIPLTP
ncbi:hypothetical protein GX441_04935, partial [bacterium]|nr:hypothetical protein [bacterium]